MIKLLFVAFSLASMTSLTFAAACNPSVGNWQNDAKTTCSITDVQTGGQGGHWGTKHHKCEVEKS